MSVTTVGEIGINHNGDFGMFKDLATNLAAKVDYVKVQMRDVSSIPTAMLDTPKTFDGEVMTYKEYKERMAIPDEWLHWLNEQEINWFPSVWDLPSLDRAIYWGRPYVKIPSAANTNLDLLAAATEYCKETGAKLVVSLGMTTEIDLRNIVNALSSMVNTQEGVINKPTLLVCNSNYPVMDDQNTNLIRMERLWQISDSAGQWLNVGFSSHSPSVMPVLYAMYHQELLKGNEGMVEFHATLNRFLPGTDHSSSLEPHDWDTIAHQREIIPNVIGGVRFKLEPGELETMKRLRG